MRKAERRGQNGRRSKVPRRESRTARRRSLRESGQRNNNQMTSFSIHTDAHVCTDMDTQVLEKKNCQTSRKRRCFLFVPIYVAFQDTPIRKRNFLFSPDFHQKLEMFSKNQPQSLADSDNRQWRDVGTNCLW